MSRKVYDVLGDGKRTASFDEKLWGNTAYDAAEKYVNMMKKGRGKDNKEGSAHCASMKWTISERVVPDDFPTPTS